MIDRGRRPRQSMSAHVRLALPEASRNRHELPIFLQMNELTQAGGRYDKAGVGQGGFG